MPRVHIKNDGGFILSILSRKPGEIVVHNTILIAIY